jgi:hypothetical protein
MRSGGILLGFRGNLVNHVQILENECEFVLWVKIDGKVFNLEQPVIFGTIYSIFIFSFINIFTF